MMSFQTRRSAFLHGSSAPRFHRPILVAQLESQHPSEGTCEAFRAPEKGRKTI